MALAKIRKAIEVEENIISCQRGIRSDPEHFYKKLFIRKVSVTSDLLNMLNISYDYCDLLNVCSLTWL